MAVLVAACFLSGLIVSALATAVMRHMAPSIGLIDQPNARKVHVVPTPLGGGIGVVAGVVLPLLVVNVLAVSWSPSGTISAWVPHELAPHLAGLSARAGQLWSIVVAGCIIAALGLLDDLRNLGWQPKLLVQLIVACGLVAGGVRGTLFIQAPWIGDILTVLWLVVLTNAFNFLDNMDGLSGGIGAIAAVVFATIMLTGTGQPHWFVGGFLLILAGSLAGFLIHNWPPAKIFMGDTGSCVLGLWLGCLTVVGTFFDYNQTGTHVVLAPLCVLAVPLYDFSSVVLIRLSEGRSPFHADKCHFSHRLVEMGLTRTQAVLTIHLVTLTTGLGGLLLYQVQGWAGALLVVGLIACVLAVIAILEMAGRRRDRNQ